MKVKNNIIAYFPVEIGIFASILYSGGLGALAGSSRWLYRKFCHYFNIAQL